MNEIKWRFKCTRRYSPLTIHVYSHIKQKICAISSRTQEHHNYFQSDMLHTKKQNKLDVFRVYENMQSRDGKKLKVIHAPLKSN